MFIAQSGSSRIAVNPQVNRARVLEKAQQMAEMMRGCSCSLDPADRADVLKLARALRTVLTKGGIALKEIGFTAAEINALIADALAVVPDRNESLTSFGFLQEQMVDEAAEMAEEIEAELVEEDEPEGEVSKVRRKPEGYQSLIGGSTREPHVRADMAALLRDFSDEHLTEMFDVLQLAS